MIAQEVLVAFRRPNGRAALVLFVAATAGAASSCRTRLRAAGSGDSVPASGAESTESHTPVHSAGAPADSSIVTTITTLRGECASFQIFDGWRVQLGSASTLRIRAPGRAGSTIDLEGEGRFAVETPGKWPTIVVRTPLVTAEPQFGVAEFAVYLYPDDTLAEVAVVGGRPVVVRHSSPASQTPDGLVAAAGSQVRAMRGGLLALTYGVPPWAYVSCVQVASGGRNNAPLRFVGTPLREAVKDLQRWYGITIELATLELGERRITAQFQDERPEQVLSLLEAALGIKSVRTGPRAYLFRDRER